MLVSGQLNEYAGSSFESLGSEAFRRSSTSSTSQRSPSKSSATMSSYCSSSSSSSSPINANAIEMQQSYSVDNSDSSQLPPFPTADPVFVTHKEDKAASGSAYDQYAAMVNQHITGDCKPSSDGTTSSFSCGSFDITPPHNSQDVGFFTKGCNEFPHDSLQQQCQLPQPPTPKKSYEHVTDKELRKKLKNRESAQAARDRKKAKMLSLERQIAELLERNRLVESENHKLRARIHQMEADAYWRIAKQGESGGAGSEASTQPYAGSMMQQTFPGGHMQYGRTDSFARNCSFTNPYATSPETGHSVPNEGVATQIDKSNFQIMNAMPQETAVVGDFSPTYAHNIWDNDTIPALNSDTQSYVMNCAYTANATSSSTAREGVIG